MKKNTSLLKDEKGFILVISLIMLMLLTIIGVATTNTSTTEIQIASHTRSYTRNFYKAEAAAKEALALLMSTPAGHAHDDHAGIHLVPHEIDMTDPAEWTDENSYPSQIFGDVVRYAARNPSAAEESSVSVEGVGGGSEDMTQGSMRVYYVLGYYNQSDPSKPDSGRIMIDLGYKQKITVE